MLREEANEVGLKKKFSIFDAGDSGKILHEIIDSSGKDALFRAQQRISLWKNALLSPEQALDAAENEWEKQMALFTLLQTLACLSSVGFDDLICLPTLLLQQNADIRYKWQMRLLICW